GRLGVDPDVELGDGGPVAFVVAATHDDDLTHPLHDAGFEARGDGNVGQRPGRHQRDGVRLSSHHGVDDELDAVLVFHRPGRLRQLDAVQAGVTMDVRCDLHTSDQRAV